MQNPKLAIKRSQSECLSYLTQVICPSPIKQTSRICPRLASEIFDMASNASELNDFSEHLEFTRPRRGRFCSAKIDYEFTKEWNSESSYTTSSHGDSESPNTMGTKNPYHQEHIFEDIASNIPSRASNPIINDSNFKQYDREPFESTSQEKLFSKLDAYEF